MAKHYRVSPKYWKGDRRRWDDRKKLLGLYLLTCEHRNLEGYYFLPKGYVQTDLGWPAKLVDQLLAELERDGFLLYDGDADVVFVVNALAHQAPTTEKQIAGAVESLRQVPSSSLWDEFLNACERHAPGLCNEIHSNANPDPIRMETEIHSNANPDPIRMETEIHSNANPDPIRMETEIHSNANPDPIRMETEIHSNANPDPIRMETEIHSNAAAARAHVAPARRHSSSSSSTPHMPPVTFDRKRVPQHRVELAERLLVEFNRQADTGYNARTGNDQPSEDLKRIIGALTRRPDVDLDTAVAAIHWQLNTARPFWEGRPHTGVVFGPKVFDSAVESAKAAAGEQTDDGFQAALERRRARERRFLEREQETPE